MVEIVRTWIVEKGFRGYVSMETFDRRTRDEGATCEECAARAERSWARLERALDEPSSLL
jgi:hypothetical protein